MSRYRNYLVAFALVVANSSPAWADHTKDFAKIIPSVVATKDFALAELEFLKNSQESGRNQLLYLYEMAGLYHLGGQWAKSAAFFDRADSVAHTYEGKAVASIGGGLAQIGAGLTNDTVLSWEGAPFDKVMSRTMNAINYLAKNDLDGAKVEIRKAAEYQAIERRRIEKKVESANEKDLSEPYITGSYGPMFSFVKDVRNSFENAFTYYLSSQIYHASGKQGLNDALVDIKQAYEMSPDSIAIREAYLDLAYHNAIDTNNEIEFTELKARFEKAPNWVPAPSSSHGTIVVIYEAGFAPKMSEVAIDLRLPKGELFSMAFPIYNDFGPVYPPLEVQAGAVKVNASKVLDIRPLAVKNLKERMPGIITRGTLGAVAKIEVQKKAEKEFGFFGKLAAKVATKALTNADLRSWLSLPSEVQVVSFSAVAGQTDLVVAVDGWSETMPINVLAGGTTFAVVRGVSGNRSVLAKNFENIDGVASASPRDLAPASAVNAPAEAPAPVAPTAAATQPAEALPLANPDPKPAEAIPAPYPVVPQPASPAVVKEVSHQPVPSTPAGVATHQPITQAVARAESPASLHTERLDALRLGDIDKTLELGLKRVSAMPSGHWTLRLEVANYSETLKGTVAAFSAGKPDLFVAPIKLPSGRIAYQLFLGEYASKSQARRAAKEVPSYFLEGNQRPIPTLCAGIPSNKGHKAIPNG